MENTKIRGAAKAYYANLSETQQREALEFFKSLDTDGNGTISNNECRNFLQKLGYTDTQNLFRMLDTNGDGRLDFEECITLFYITKMGGVVSCDGCGAYLWDIYFVCVECYKGGGNTYDLCCDCYRNKNFQHQHRVFLDNFTLLQAMKPSKKDNTMRRLKELKLGMEIGDVAANICNQM